MSSIIIKKLYKSCKEKKYRKVNFYKDDYYQNYITEDEKELVKEGIYNNHEAMPYSTVEKILNTIHTNETDIFYDLGSGLGKLLVQTFFHTNCKKLVGIEYFEELHNVAIKVKDNINDNSRLHFIKANIVNLNINEATIIYFGVLNHDNASCKEDDILIKSVENKINNSKNIRIVISLCILDIKHNMVIEKQCVPSILPHIVKGYPYPHFFYFIK